MSTTTTPNHIGRKIGRIRELRGMKQEALAQELGVSQQTVSIMEKSESVEAGLLEQVAKILGVTPEAIENYDEDKVINYFNTFNDVNHGAVGNNYHTCTFNPLDKLIESYEENKRIQEEKDKLYERLLQAEKSLLQAEKDKVAYLERLLDGKKGA